MPIPLYTSSLPTTQPFTERPTPPAVWEGYVECVYVVRPQAEVCEAAMFVCAQV